MPQPLRLALATLLIATPALSAQQQQPNAPNTPATRPESTSTWLRNDIAWRQLAALELRPELLASRIDAAEREIANAPSKDEEIARRFSAGTDVVSQIDGALNTVSLIHEALLVEQRFNQTTNIWSDAEIRKGWDDIQKWSTTLGYVVAAGSLVALDGDKQATGAGLGLGLTGLVSLIGNVIGPDSKKRIEQKANFIDFTRAAFDDIRVRSDLSESYKMRNDSVLAALQKFKREVYDRATTADERAEALAQLDWYVRAFDTSLEQLPEILALHGTMIARYKAMPVQGDVRKKLDELETRVGQMRNRYDSKVKAFLALSPKLRATLLGFTS